MSRITGKDFKKILTKKNLKQWYIHDSLSQVDIAKKLGCTKSLVGKYMKDYGIKIRRFSHCVLLGMMKSSVRCTQNMRRLY